MKKIFLLLIILMNFSKLFSQEKNLIEIGVDNYHFHFADEDLAVAPDYPYNYSKGGLKLGYYYNPTKLFAFYSSFNLGIGHIDRGFPQYYANGIQAVNRDLLTYQEIFIGSSYNPLCSNKLFFHFGIGLNRLFLEGNPDYTYTQNSSGLTFVNYGGSAASSYWVHWLNSMSSTSNNQTTIKGYPDFERISFALDIGAHVKIYHTFHFYFNLTPIFVTPIRFDYNLGFSWIGQ